MTERVAWVTGASRGVGRGIAVSLGAAGWTVWVTARSAQGHGTGHLPGTIEETAEAVTRAGGRGVAVPCDHRDDDQVWAVRDRLAGEHAGLQLLVNNVWAGYERLNAGAWEEWNAPFWTQPIELFDAMFTGGVRAHYVTAALCAPLLIASPGSLMITVSMQITPSQQPGFGVAYGMAKAAADRFALATAHQLRPHDVTSVALHPGLVRTEGVMQFADHLDLTSSQSPEGVGRAVAALAADPAKLSRTGQALTVTDLAQHYDLDIAT
jgi:NAD(P)-dependent dehydrogenase (short-subunit alcohol dehydrogenase family)